MKKFFLIALMLLFSASVLQAQFYAAPTVGFKAYSLKGGYFVTRNGENSKVYQAEVSKTSFNFGATVGYQVIPSRVAKNMYKLDVGIDISYSSVPLFETGYDYVNGSGRFSADGLSGGKTRNLSFDIVPLHRLNFPKFQLLSPYAGVGIGLDMFNTKDLDWSANAQSQKIKGNNEFKVGFIVSYGTVIRATKMIQPFFHLRHYIGSKSETQMTADPTNGNFIIKDSPSYFQMVAGCRFVFGK